jgi:Arc/MetJ family transcription regulator
MATIPIQSAIRKTRSFSLDQEVLAEVERTKGSVSASERVNQLLRYALETERKASLHQEAAQFFSGEPNDRAERRAFQKAGVKSWSRE